MANPGAENLSNGEFIALIASLISLVALSIDTMLPALPEIGRDLGLTNLNDTQLVVSVFFFGMGLGQLAAGPLSDSFGRKPIIYGGICLFFVGCLICIFSWNFESMLVGRLLQGLGASAPRVVTLAIVRDQFAGRAMARVMSFVMAVFIIVPAIAPAIAPAFGQLILYLSGWRTIFIFFFLLAASALIWFARRQPETLPAAKRLPFSLGQLFRGFSQSCANPITLGYTVAVELVNGAFVGYLSSAQQLFADAYDRASEFPLYFGLLALAIGAGSITNGRMVMKFAMRTISLSALVVMTLASLVCVALLQTIYPVLPFWLFMLWAAVSFFCYGTVTGNFNALAMEPMGHIAGVAAAVVGFVSTLLSVIAGVYIGRLFDGTATPLVAAFAGLGAASLGVVLLGDYIRVYPSRSLTIPPLLGNLLP